MSNNSEMQQDNLILPTFLIMLLDVADLIFEKMDPMDLLTTRKVSRGLRTAVDKFGIRFDEIHFCYYGKHISLYVDEAMIDYSINEDGDTSMSYKEKRIVIENENFVEIALNDLKPVLQSNYIKLSLTKYEEESYTNFNFLTTLIAWLESEKCVRVDYILLSYFLFDEVLTILPYLDDKRLQLIYLYGEDELELFERITHLDQWTNVIKFELVGSQFNFDQIEHLFQFKSFIIKVDKFSVQNAIKIRDDLMKRSTFDSCQITFDASKIHRIDIANVFDSNSTRSRPWRFKYSNDEYKFWIRVTVDEKDMEYTLYVKRIETSERKQHNLILPILPNLPLELVAQNLDHMDRSSTQKSNNCSKKQMKGVFQPSLLNMPLDVADLVFEKMESMDLLRTRKVCRGFKAAIDHFGVRLVTIDFKMKDDRIKMSLDGYYITYYDAVSGGTTVTYKEQKIVIENGNFVEMALNDLKLALKSATSLNIFNETEERDDMIITSFLDFLRTEECIHVKGIRFENFSYDDVIEILPYCDAQTLEHIRFWCGRCSPGGIKALFDLDQWKVSKSFKSYDGFSNGELLHYLFHLEKFKVAYSEFSDEDIIQIRDDLMRRSTFKKCHIYFRNYFGEESKVLRFKTAKVFKPDIDSNEDYNIEYSNENGRFRIEITGDDGYCSLKGE